MHIRNTFVAALALLSLPVAAQEATAPDGSKAFGIDPYIGVIGGYHSFDRDVRPSDPVGSRMEGWLVGGVAGFNVPLGPVFVGAEGNAAKGFNDIDWEYGARGRFGFRAGESGLIYASAGYQWVQGRRGFENRHDVMYGVGVEVGPQSIGLGGITGESGPRLRLAMETYGDFESLRPSVGVIWHF
jgi:outer membrane immunogenic protein